MDVRNESPPSSLSMDSDTKEDVSAKTDDEDIPNRFDNRMCCCNPICCYNTLISCFCVPNDSDDDENIRPCCVGCGCCCSVCVILTLIVLSPLGIVFGAIIIVIALLILVGMCATLCCCCFCCCTIFNKKFWLKKFAQFLSCVPCCVCCCLTGQDIMEIREETGLEDKNDIVKEEDNIV